MNIQLTRIKKVRSKVRSRYLKINLGTLKWGDIKVKDIVTAVNEAKAGDTVFLDFENGKVINIGQKI